MVKEAAVEFKSGDLILEGRYCTPDEGSPDKVLVVCHPHPQYGGDMYNTVVGVAVMAAIEAGMAALTFNFRGVGASQGSHDGGKGERDDVRAALQHARSLPGISTVAMAGYSFGAGMAAAAVDADVPALVLVALPPGMVPEDSGLRSYKGPVLLVSGSADHVSPAGAVKALAADLPDARVRIVEGADHFWWGHERALADAVRDFLNEVL